MPKRIDVKVSRPASYVMELAVTAERGVCCEEAQQLWRTVLRGRAEVERIEASRVASAWDAVPAEGCALRQRGASIDQVERRGLRTRDREFSRPF